MYMDKKTRSLYNAVHYWLAFNYGKACKCESKNCLKKSTNYQWAKLKDKEYNFDRNNFIQMCRSCHAKYDWTEEAKEMLRKRSTKEYCIRNHKLSEENTTFVINRGNKERRCILCHRIRSMKSRKKIEMALAKAEYESKLSKLKEIK